MTDATVPAWWDRHPLRLAVLAVAVIAIAASFTGLWNGFAYDDVLMIPENPAVRFLRAPLAFLIAAVGPLLYSAVTTMKPSISATFFCQRSATGSCDGPQAGDTASAKSGIG